jgi:hypothetical protein
MQGISVHLAVTAGFRRRVTPWLKALRFLPKEPDNNIGWNLRHGYFLSKAAPNLANLRPGTERISEQ